MDSFVRKQLEHIGLNENTHRDICLGFQELTEADFRGLTVQKVKLLLKNRPELQMEILAAIEVLRENSAYTAGQLSSNGNTTDTSGDIKPQPIDYSSDSDIEVMSEEDVTVEEKPPDNDNCAPVKIERPHFRPTKRIKLVNLSDEESSSTGDENENSSNHPTNDRNSLRKSAQSTSTKTNPSSSTTRMSTFVQEPNAPGVNDSFASQNTTTKRSPDDSPIKIHYTYVGSEFIGTLISTLAEGGALPGDTNYKFNLSVKHNDRDLSVFHNNLGRYTEGLELAICTRVSNHPRREDWWTKDYVAMLYISCPKLKVLTLNLKPATHCNNLKFAGEPYQSGKFHTLPDLQEINLTHCSAVMFQHMEILLKSAKNLQRFHFRFERVEHVEMILKLIHKLSLQNYLQKVKELRFVGQEKNVSLNFKHFITLANLNLSCLNYLEIGCGLEDVSKEYFEAVMNKYSSTLEVFHCSGTFFGADPNYFSITVPRMDKLRYFNLGGDYEFDSNRAEKNLVTIDLRSVNGKEEVRRVQSVAEKGFINFGLQLWFLYPSLETIRIGNKCTLEDLHFFNFPNLKTFRVGGPWDRMIKLPSPTSRNPSYPKIEVIQLPDLLINESFVMELPRVFPNLTTVYMWLPSAKCLETFFKTMVKTNLSQLYLKTNFIFSWTLSEILIGRHLTGVRSSAELMKLEQLKSYKYYKEYVAYHNIDFPKDDPDIDILDEENLEVYRNIMDFMNTTLRLFRIEHIGRHVRVPMGEYHFQDSRCEYRPELIGYQTNYPLSTKYYLDGFNLCTTLTIDGTWVWGKTYRLKNFKMTEIVSQNMFISQHICHHDGPKCAYTDTCLSCGPQGQFKVTLTPTRAVLSKTGKLKEEQ